MSPFKSKKQAKWMFKNKPKMAEEFASHTNFSSLPDAVKSLREKYRKKNG